MRRTIQLAVFFLILAALAFAADFRSAASGSSVSVTAAAPPIPDHRHPPFRFSRIDFPGAASTLAAAINARGDVVGSYQDSAGNTHGFLLRQGTFSTIDFPDASLTFPRAINARGDIAGQIFGLGGDEHGFLLHDGVFAQIDFPGASATTARGINNVGDITGRYFDAAGNERGFIFKDGTFRDVFVPGACSTDVWMAQDNEYALVGDICTDADGGIHGYIRNKAGKFKLIDYPRAGAPCSAVRWINESGDMVGVYANTLEDCFNFVGHGFLLHDGEYTAIDIPGSQITRALGINDDGVIVGQYIDGKGVAHGFLAETKDER